MKKIMFDDKFGLTDDVLKGHKTMTRRIVQEKYLRIYEDMSRLGQPCCPLEEWLIRRAAAYKVGEVVAVAQSYRNVEEYNPESYEDVMLNQGTICEASHPYSHLMKSGGWDNKMFVRADLMPHQIRITDIKVERLQDISDEDCLKEGIIRRDDMINSQMEDVVRYTFENSFVDGVYKTYATPREAFAAFIERPGIGHKVDWSRNNWVFVYTFGLIK